MSLKSYYGTPNDHDGICPVCGATIPDIEDTDGHAGETCSPECYELDRDGKTLPLIRPLWNLLCDIYGTPTQLEFAREYFDKHIYKYSDCGAGIHFVGCDAIELSSIVEDVDSFGCSLRLQYPFTQEEFFNALQGIEDECDELYQMMKSEELEEGLTIAGSNPATVTIF
jgi:hypothetical protein